MRILFVAMAESIHAARWISQVTGQGWDLYLFPSVRRGPHPLLRNITVFGANPWRARELDRSVRFIRRSSVSFWRDALEGRLQHKILQKNKENALLRAIRSVKPDIIHSLELQHAGYLTLKARKKLGGAFPTWIATNWGSDIYLFRKFPEHQQPIREVLQNCDYYSCECERDIRLAQEMGLRGQVLPVWPNAGGMDIGYAKGFRQKGPVSHRKCIIVKGYQGWAGRALVALQAFRLCLDVLRDYTIAVYAASKETAVAARRFMQETGLRVQIIPPCAHEEILKIFGRSRIYIGLSISDGISTSLLDAMVMGAFPIQSCTACVDEWLVDGQSGLIVPPEDPELLEKAIRRALTDDALVDGAKLINDRTVVARLDYSKIQTQVIQMYQDIYEARKV